MLKLLNELSLRARIAKLSDSKDSIDQATANYLKLKLQKLDEYFTYRNVVDKELRSIAKQLVTKTDGKLTDEDEIENYAYDEIVHKFGFDPKQREEKEDTIRAYVDKVVEYYKEYKEDLIGEEKQINEQVNVAKIAKAVAQRYGYIKDEDELISVIYDELSAQIRDPEKVSLLGDKVNKIVDYYYNIIRGNELYRDDYTEPKERVLKDEDIKDIVKKVVDTYGPFPDHTVFGDILFHYLEDTFGFDDPDLVSIWSEGLRIYKELYQSDKLKEEDEEDYQDAIDELDREMLRLDRLSDEELEEVADEVFETIKDTKQLSEDDIKEAIGLALEDIPGYEITPLNVIEHVIDRVYEKLINKHGKHLSLEG